MLPVGMRPKTEQKAISQVQKLTVTRNHHLIVQPQTVEIWLPSKTTYLALECNLVSLHLEFTGFNF